MAEPPAQLAWQDQSVTYRASAACPIDLRTRRYRSLFTYVLNSSSMRRYSSYHESACTNA